MLEYLITVVIGYLLGCFQVSYYLGKIFKKIDIREYGSNNAGASNATIVMGWKYGALTVFCDISKAIVAIMIIHLVFPDNPILKYLAGTTCIIGHIFPFYMKFKGGKGFASYIGMIIAIDFKIAIIAIIGIIAITIISDYIVIATLSVISGFPIYKLYTGEHIVILGLLTFIFIVIFIKHFINIKRIYKGEEIGLRSLFRKECES